MGGADPASGLAWVAGGVERDGCILMRDDGWMGWRDIPGVRLVYTCFIARFSFILLRASEGTGPMPALFDVLMFEELKL